MVTHSEDSLSLDAWSLPVVRLLSCKNGAFATAATLIIDTVNYFSNFLTSPSRKWYVQSLVVGSPSGSQTMNV